MSRDLADLTDPLVIEPLTAPLTGTAQIPGSKSITNRALICAALAEGTSTLDGVLFADDTEAMIDCLQRLGIGIEVDRSTGRLFVTGCGGRLPAATAELDARFSGTTARFIVAVLALGSGPYRLDGAEPLRARPMGPALQALADLGATVVEASQPGHLPVSIGGGPLVGGEVRVTADLSSQFLSGLLLTAPCLRDPLTIYRAGVAVSQPYLEMTVAVVTHFGGQITKPDPATFVVSPTGYRATPFSIEPDASAASYFFAAAAITGGRVRVEGLGTDSVQGDLAFVDGLERMGAEVERGSDFTEVRGTGVLHGIQWDMRDLSDTAQTLAAVAVFADSPTEVTGIGFIRGKETDRIAAVVTELRRCGIGADETDDGFRLVPGRPQPATVQTYDDHRMAMSFALLGLRVSGIQIADPGCVAKTFPGYWDEFDRLRSEDD
jgi:3-phosphoshikimate 1-carboxyvinyltransferase